MYHKKQMRHIKCKNVRFLNVTECYIHIYPRNLKGELNDSNLYFRISVIHLGK